MKIPLVVTSTTTIEHMNRHDETSHNILVVIGWDDRIMFADAGWPRSVHDQKVLFNTVRCYPFTFPKLSWGKYLLVDSGYPSRYGFLPPYPHFRYHMDDFTGNEAAPPTGKEETFNYMHSPMRNTVERAFGVIRTQWRILRGIPLFPNAEDQTKIIQVVFDLHKFGIDNDDPYFLTQNPLYNGYPRIPMAPPLRTWYDAPNNEEAMSAYRDTIADQVFIG